MGFCIKVTFVHTQARFPFPCERPELPAEITLKPYGDPRNVMISR